MWIYWIKYQITGAFTLKVCKLILFVEPAGGSARHNCYNISSVYVRASVRLWIRPDLSRP